MKGEDFLKVADLLLADPSSSEPHFRAAVGRAYYALFLEGRDWLRAAGLISIDGSRDDHAIVPSRFRSSSLPDVVEIASGLCRLRLRRNWADYELPGLPAPLGNSRTPPQASRGRLKPFAGSGEAVYAVRSARSLVGKLKQIDRDPARCRAAIESIRRNAPRM